VLLKQIIAERNFKRKLKELIGFRPSNISLYRQAFTHKSSISSKDQKTESNERLEFLGDAVLSLVIGAYLFEKYPDEDEGFLSQIRARVVNRELFNELGGKMKLNQWMQEVSPYKPDLDSSPAILGNTFEALVGAIYLDKGYDTAMRFFEKTVLVYHLNIDDIQANDANYKSRLLEWGQKNMKKIEFNLINSRREGNKLEFEVEVKIDGEVFGTGTEAKKKKAEQIAAKQAMQQLDLIGQEQS
jgi:ribonuclease-3